MSASQYFYLLLSALKVRIDNNVRLCNLANMDTVLPDSTIGISIEEPDRLTKGGGLLLKPLEQTRFTAIDKGDTQFFVHGKITYDDPFAVHHWTFASFISQIPFCVTPEHPSQTVRVTTT
jgi:hypothetical protein